MAGGPDSKKNSVPAWQQNYRSETAGTEQSLEANAPKEDSSSGGDLIDQAKQFLQDESIRDASRERKVEFLEKKGLQGDDIHKLLDLEDGTSTASQQDSDMKTIHDSTVTASDPNTSAPSSPSAASQLPASSIASPSPPQPTLKHDIPPIITYPEFLLRPQKPPPLITIERLSYVLYALAGVSTLTYSASKYLIGPMLSNLNRARHELAASTLDKLEDFNEKLEGNVSSVPFTLTASMLLKQAKDSAEKEANEDAASEASDPTELFHRDIATQTTPHLTRTHSRGESVSTDSTNDFSMPGHAHTGKNASEAQATRLKSLHTTLSSLLDDVKSSSFEDELSSQHSLSESLTDLQSYLDHIQFSSNASAYTDYTSSSVFKSAGTAQTSNTSTAKNQQKKDENNDQAAIFKAEIRSLKGALLSSRNFPVAQPSASHGRPGLGSSSSSYSRERPHADVGS